MVNSDGLTDWQRVDDEVCQKQGVKVSSFFVPTKLFDSTGDFYFYAFEKPEVISLADDRVHIVLPGCCGQYSVG